MGDDTNRPSWPWRTAWLGLLLSIGSVLTALLAAIGTGAGAWDYGFGLGLLRYALFAAVAGAVVATVAFILARRTHARTGWINAVALTLSLAFIAYLGTQISRARSVPAIHDATTNLDDLPQFTRLEVRPDNLAQVPDQGRRDLAAMAALDRWKSLHREAYPDLRPVRLPLAPAQVVQKAAQLAQDRGWDVARIDPGSGIVEATATSLFFRFKDDFLVRVRPDPRRAGNSIVDLRSVSRVGVSDLGVNADRIREFASDLQSN